MASTAHDEDATTMMMCQGARKRRKTLGGGSGLVPAVSGEVNLDF